MNREVVNKYINVLNYWRQDGQVWMKNLCKPKRGWILEANPEFNRHVCDILYVQNDEYAELRKLLADDIKIIYKFGTWEDSGKVRWIDLKVDPISIDFGNDFWNYEWKIKDEVKGLFEVKPDEYYIEETHEFKVGNWITRGNQIGHIDSIHDGDYDRDCYIYEWKCYQSFKQLELWKPKQGEYCWFWDNDEKPTLAKFGLRKNKWWYSTEGLMCQNCEPFIGTLPTTLIQEN